MAAVLVLVAASGFVAPLRCIPLRSKPVCCEPPQPPQSPQELSKATPPVEPAKTYSSGWSGEGRFADEDALPLSFWIFGNSPRRAVIAGLTSAVIGPAVNLWGSGSFLLSLAPDVSREQKLDTFYPVSNKFLYPYNNGYLDYIDGYKRYVDQSPVPRYEFRYPATYVQDQSVFLRNADRAYAQRVADPQNVMGGGRPRSSGGPEVAFGPPDTRGEENLSIVTGSLPAGFSLRDTFGTAADGAERLIQAQIAKPGLREATLLSASMLLARAPPSIFIS